MADSTDILVAQADNPWASGGGSASEPAGAAPDAGAAAASNPWGGSGGSATGDAAASSPPGTVSGTPDWLSQVPAAPEKSFDWLHPFDHSVIPLNDWVDSGLNWVVAHFRPVFQAIRYPIDAVLSFIEAMLQGIPPILMIALVGLLAWQVAGRRLAIGAVLSLTFVGLIGAWTEAMVTLALVFTSVFFCVVIGLPTGIWLARNDRAAGAIRPVLDAMQTTPAFVYLVPIVMLFGIGNVPGVVVTIIFALPPLIRLTNLAIRQVPSDLIEAARSFGASKRQLLYKVQLPIAMPTIMAGVNQTLMLALSMVVIASMIAVGGLGQMVLRGIGRLDMGLATVGGVGIVILAILIDRMTQALGQSRRERGNLAWYETGPAGLVRGLVRQRRESGGDATSKGASLDQSTREA
ncbi:MAG: glycine betaine/L-proline ABC transporter permease ProW [Fulvimarina manganoxydans]|uniref:glycine betaine/L-proline ABC transporter permease ProW n=1 Tax=Fulvimarina manganoxydans TaxID=937218 RepID=UPI0023564EBC|nr:glycine betaine/L-proline ABC transporter permease ProW [Fulvimarina manganoxydans]MCK5932866.1 glycine betaine/L-proline ABC transporter permease ProW [Fulvimarina manganoxydans]